jgi:ABC-type transport system involved in multi-copper enzyme maturation permease subunit
MKLPKLNPVSLFFGPVFQKEMRSAGRRSGTYIARSVTAIGLLGACGLAFTMWAVNAESSGLGRVQSLQSLAPALAMIVIWFQYITLAFFSPQMTAGGICDERRAQTLSALLTTPLRPSEIVFGKLSSRIVQILILSLISVPLLLAIRIFGGLSADFVIGGTVLVLSTAFLGASLALMSSLWSRSAAAAAGTGLVLLALTQIGPFVAEALRVTAIDRLVGAPVATFHNNVMATCSPYILFNLSYSTSMGIEPESVSFTVGGSSLSLGPAWAVNAMYSSLLGVGSLVLTSVLLRRTMRRMASEGPPPARESRRARRRRLRQRATRPGAAPDVEPVHRPSVHRASRTLWGNPVLWRELRQPSFGSRRRLILLILAVIAGLLLLYWRVPLREEALHMLFISIGVLVIVGQAAGLTSMSIAAEREASTWEALIATPMTGRQILFAKFACALRNQWFFPAILFTHILVSMLGGVYNWLVVPLVLLILAGPVVLFTATGQFLALAIRRQTASSGINFGLALSLYIGPWIIAALWQEFGRDVFESLYGKVFYAINPMAMGISTLSRSILAPGQMPSSFEIAGARVGSGTFIAVVVGIFLLYCAIAWGVLALGARHFARFSGRSS